MVKLQTLDSTAPTFTRTHCPYCALQCGMELRGEREWALVTGDLNFPANRGALCVKGGTAASTLAHPQRLLAPPPRPGRRRPGVPWDEALDGVAHGLRKAQAGYGADAAGVFGSGALTNEKAYLLGKFARLALGTASIDYTGRFCMSSGAAAGQQALGVDRGLPFPLDDIAEAEVILLVGSNVAETMPPIMQYFEAQREKGGTFIVVDPRRSFTAQAATMHLQLTPGTDAVLANGLLHILVRDGLIEPDYIRERTGGFEQLMR